MTPKEKAEELLEKMNVIHRPKGNGLPVYMNKSQVKRCALIAVTQIINEYESNICNTGYDYDFERWDMQRDYWKEVQFEIENLKTK